MKSLLFSAALALAGSTFAAQASEPQPEAKRVHKALTADDFAAQAEAIRQQMEPGGRYEFLTPTERDRVEALFTEIHGFLARHRDLAGLTDRELAALVSDQDEANAILTRRDGERLVCANEARTGTHIPNVNCQRYAEREQARRYTQDYFRDSIMKATQSSRMGGGGEGGGGGGGGGGH